MSSLEETIQGLLEQILDCDSSEVEPIVKKLSVLIGQSVPSSEKC